MSADSQHSRGIHALNPLATGGSRQELSAIRTLEGWSDKALPILGRVAAVGGLVAASFLGVGGLITAGVVLLGFEVARAHLHNKADLNRELALYHKDIARVLGKAEDAALTLQDMYNAADEKKLGDRALKPLKAELDHLRYRGKFNIIMGAVRAVVTTAITGALGGALSHIDSVAAMQKSAMSIFWTVSGSLGISSMANAACESIGWNRFDAGKPPSTYTDLVRIQETARQQNVTPEQVFAVALKQDQGLSAEIEAKFGMAFDSMTIRNKQRVIRQYEPRVHARLMAEHINEGASVTIIPLSLAGQLDIGSLRPLPAKEAGEEPEKSEDQSKAIPDRQKKFTARLLESRAASAAETAGSARAV